MNKEQFDKAWLDVGKFRSGDRAIILETDNSYLYASGYKIYVNSTNDAEYVELYIKKEDVIVLIGRLSLEKIKEVM